MSRKTLSVQQRLLLIQLLVQSFADFAHYIPVDATRILVTAELPPVLERVTERIQASSQAWFAWTDNRRTWFLVAEMATDGDETNYAAALRILFYDEDGVCVAAGTWAFHADGQWTLLSL